MTESAFLVWVFYTSPVEVPEDISHGRWVGMLKWLVKRVTEQDWIGDEHSTGICPKGERTRFSI